MRFDLITIFPSFFDGPFGCGVLGRALERGLVELHVHDLRRWTTDRHRTVDARPYGGGAGMVLKPEPIARAIEELRPPQGRGAVVLTSPQGEPLSDSTARLLAGMERVVVVCGRYEGVDERIRDHYVDLEISIGDFVLTGGEYAAAAIVDAVARYVPGVVGNEASVGTESFRMGLLDHPHYTRPELFRGLKVPEVLLSGDHARIAEWRRRESIRRTFLTRPDLLDRASLSAEEWRYVRELAVEHRSAHRAHVALVHYPVYNRKFEIVATAFTNLDVHDISRAARTYGVRRFYLVHPLREQRALIERVLAHWLKPSGVGNASKREAMELVSLVPSIEEAVAEVERREGARPKVVATDARLRDGLSGYGELRERIMSGEEPYLILFGTGSGLAREVIDGADYVLAPIWGSTRYNHLSVRSAAAVTLDRLLTPQRF